MWDEHPDLLLWLLYIGGAFVPAGTLRSEYVALLSSNNAVRFNTLYRSQPDVLEVLKRFIWSEKAFTLHVKALWEESLRSTAQLRCQISS